MDSISLLHPCLDFKDNNNKEKKENDLHMNSGITFDSSALQKQSKIPKQFIWPQAQRPTKTLQELNAPTIDLQVFGNEHQESTQHSLELIRKACSTHGFLQVVNHGIDPILCSHALDFLDHLFKDLSSDKKLRAHRRPGSTWGYAGAHSDRFSSKLPWKETFSFGYSSGKDGNENDKAIVDYFVSELGKDFEDIGVLYQKYCGEMLKLSLKLVEVLGMSLGLEKGYFRELFEDGSGILRCNFYPSCKEPELALGTGPHCDPTALTILQQDQVGGLEVFANGSWQTVNPVRGALVINIGDTFMALTNGNYKSCLHRAVVNPYRGRKSIAFFLNPKGNKTIKPPSALCSNSTDRMYIDFTWSELLEFTQKHYRADTGTLQNFSNWIKSIRKM